jgi:hypothetical protein
MEDPNGHDEEDDVMADVTAKGLQDKIAEAIEKQRKVLETLKKTAQEVTSEQQGREQSGEQRGG